jgi:hypothetical protein
MVLSRHRRSSVGGLGGRGAGGGVASPANTSGEPALAGRRSLGRSRSLLSISSINRARGCSDGTPCRAGQAAGTARCSPASRRPLLLGLELLVVDAAEHVVGVKRVAQHAARLDVPAQRGPSDSSASIDSITADLPEPGTPVSSRGRCRLSAASAPRRVSGTAGPRTSCGPHP